MKKLIFVFLTLSCLLTLNAQVTIYTDCGYQGKSKQLTEKSYYNAGQFGLPDNSISSIKVAKGYSAELYANPNMTGRKIVFTSAVSCFPAIINNSVSSIVIKKIANNDEPIANNGNVSVYRRCNYIGSVTHLPVGKYANLRSKINGGTPESLQVPKGLIIELYSGLNYSGTLIGTYDANQSCLPSHIIKSAKSAKVYPSNSNNIVPETRNSK